MLQANYTFSKKHNNGKGAYLCAFFLPVFVMTVILICNLVYPIGEECFLRTDMYHQYAPFFSEFREKLQNGSSLFYTWNIGLGVNFTALYAYYLASPLNWLLIFCPETLVIEFMMLLVVLKIGLAGLSMTCYLQKHSKRADFGTAFFGIFYALSGYVCAYYWNLMWLDCIVLFPLVVLGMEALMEEKRGMLYAFSLGISILSNYYISIMICMFLVIYFFAYQLLSPAENRKAFFGRAGRFALYSLLAGGMAAVLLLPEIWALSHTASADVQFPKTFSEYFSILDMMARHMPGVETEQALKHWPNIYCGAAVLLLFGLYVSSHRISLKEKAVYLLMLLFFLMSFSINVLNFIWHGFHYPNSLPARQSFIYIFLMLAICERVYEERRFITKRQLGGAFLAAVVFILLCQETVTSDQFHFAVFYGSLFLVGIYALILMQYLRRRILPKTAAFLTLFVIAAEVSANAALTSITTTSRVSYTKDNADVRAIVDSLIPSEEFFRVEKINRKTKNDGAWMNFPSVSLFSSMANADCSDFFETLGCEASTNAYSITGSTPFVNMLFSVRYAIYNSPQEDDAGKSFVRTEGESYLYRNNYSLPLGFMMPKAMARDWMLELDNPALVQDALCDQLGISTVLKPNTELGSESGRDYAVTIGETGEYYAFVTNPKVKSVTVNWPDKKKTFEHVDRGYLLELGICYAGDLIKMYSETEKQDMEVQLYRFDYAALDALYEKLSAYPLRLTRWEDDRLQGTVSVDPKALGYEGKTATLFLSIPYDEGWQITVDGKRAEAVKAFDTFLALELDAGVHEISMHFVPKGLKSGAMISAGSLLLLLFLGAAAALRRRKEAALALQKDEDFEDFDAPFADEEDFYEEEDAPFADEDTAYDNEDADEEAPEASDIEAESKRDAFLTKEAQDLSEDTALDAEFEAMFGLGKTEKPDMLERLSALPDAALEETSEAGTGAEASDRPDGGKAAEAGNARSEKERGKADRDAAEKEAAAFSVAANRAAEKGADEIDALIQKLIRDGGSQ